MIRKLLKKPLFWIVSVLLIVVLGGFYLYSYTGVFSTLEFKIRSLIEPPLTAEEYLAAQAEKDWDFNTQITTANILDYDPEGRTVTLSFIYPVKLAEKLGVDNPVKTVKVSCSNEDSRYFVTKIKASDTTGASNETKLIESNTDLFDTMRVGDAFFGFCADEDCNEINKNCELHQAIVEE